MGPEQDRSGESGQGLKTESWGWNPCSRMHSSLQKGGQKHMQLPKVPKVPWCTPMVTTLETAERYSLPHPQGQRQLKLDPKPVAQVCRTTWASKRLKIMLPWQLEQFLLRDDPRYLNLPRRQPRMRLSWPDLYLYQLILASQRRPPTVHTYPLKSPPGPRTADEQS